MKKFTNKSLDKKYISPLKDGLPVCSICHKHKSDAKYRKMYDYISCEYDMVFCCGKCESSIIEDSLL